MNFTTHQAKLYSLRFPPKSDSIHLYCGSHFRLEVTVFTQLQIESPHPTIVFMAYAIIFAMQLIKTTIKWLKHWAKNEGQLVGGLKELSHVSRYSLYLSQGN